MFSFLKPRQILSVEDWDFQVATFAWLLRNFGGDSFYKDTVIVLPTKEFFPAEVDSEEEAVKETFKAVKKYAGMEEWQCVLKQQEKDIDAAVAPTLTVQNAPNNPLGTFEVKSEEEVVITYNPSLVKNPNQLVSTLAHELAHYLTATSQEEPPGGWDNWEFATDITATFLGFGIFMSNSAFNFRQYTEVDSQGWQYNRSGYLTESEHIFALAIFSELKEIPLERILLYLKPNLRKLLKLAINQLSKSNVIETLKSVNYEGPKCT